ncbi:MAG: hypothetical protein PHY43_10680 [Verrucomicrobiales bacterium]|nr:hypothetical protein [Verrucomicrobiales bacterium]
MNPRQFDIWKAQPAGFEKPHWFVILSGSELCADERETAVNGLACFTLRGEPLKTDVRLNGADGFDHATVCACDFFFHLKKSELRAGLGSVTVERRDQIRKKIREVLRLG